MFVDFNKAFHSLYHDKIWLALAQQNVPKIIIQLLENMYSKSTASIGLDTTGDKFLIKRGVRQGDPLSLNLFNAVLEEFF